MRSQQPTKVVQERRRSRIADQITAWFIGPKGESSEFCRDQILHIFEEYRGWRKSVGVLDKHIVDYKVRKNTEPLQGFIEDQLNDLSQRFKLHYPFFSPRYIAHMLSEQTIPAVLGYFTAMLYNPNNVTDEAAPVTVELELQVIAQVATMLGYSPTAAWGHIVSGGTLANLEALWIARAVQFFPLTAWEYAKQMGMGFNVTLPTGDVRDIRRYKNDELRKLVQLRPKDSLDLLGRIWSLTLSNEEHREAFRQCLRESEYNPRYRGISALLHKLKLEPRIFVSAAAHYSISKAANVLGYGEGTVKAVPVNTRFRIELSALAKHLHEMKENEFVAAVIGIVGTTEEGAVDLIQKMSALREHDAQQSGRGWWFHIDAAWGGYFATALRNNRGGWDTAQLAQEHETFVYDSGKKVRKPIAWRQRDVIAAYKSINESDSVTVDPHKTGYIPYPAGMVLFRDNRACHLVKKDARYIFEAEPDKCDDHGYLKPLKAIGPYIIEGSKPGAAAASCWLAHQAIPLHKNGHGIIVRETLFSADRLATYLELHHARFGHFESETRSGQSNGKAFSFTLVCRPDTNVIPFIAQPYSTIISNGCEHFKPEKKDLEWLNRLNSRIWEHFSLRAGEHTQIQHRNFFLSRTEFRDDQYSAESLKDLLEMIGVTADQYKAKNGGLVVLRATVMNPFYGHLRRRGSDLLSEFVKELHRVTRSVLTDMK